MTRRHTAALAITLLISYAYFFQAGGWNQNSRFDLIRALTERGTVRIDGYDQNTGDKAILDGHVYSDKAPGQALTATPVVAVARVLARMTGVGTEDAPVALLAYLATVWAAGLPTVVAAVCLASAARQLGSLPIGAVFAAVAYGLGTPAWAYATLLWGNALAAGSLMVAFAAAVDMRSGCNPARVRRLALVAGIACGWAVVTEYPAAPAAAGVAALGAFHTWHAGRHHLRLMCAWLSVGALAAIAVLAAYNQAAFGSPLHIGYQNVEEFNGMQQGLLGVTTPDPVVLQEILFGSFRGLLPIAPLLALSPVGLILLWHRCPKARASVLAATYIVVYYLLLNSSYVYWSGGASFGPRLAGAALPFTCLGLAEVATRVRGPALALATLLAGYGITVVGMAVATMLMLPDDVDSPLAQIVWPAFVRGDLALNRWTFGVQPGVPGSGLSKAWNVGQLLGLDGLLSLAPLMLVWILAAGVWRLRAMRFVNDLPAARQPAAARPIRSQPASTTRQASQDV